MVPCLRRRQKVLVDAVKKANCRAILIGSCFLNMELDDEMMKRYTLKNLFPIFWLLPKCSMMLSHGSSGVVHSTLRAGIPAVICPSIFVGAFT
jgi:UDP:flavonoid glycosyltransferase YjiC (YdhE family)